MPPPTHTPSLVATRYDPPRGSTVGGWVLTVQGCDGLRRPYETEIHVFRESRRTLKATNAVYWSNFMLFISDDDPRMKPTGVRRPPLSCR